LLSAIVAVRRTETRGEPIGASRSRVGQQRRLPGRSSC
jgi:hypothetical protein